MTKHPAIRSPKLIEWARDHSAGCQIRYPFDTRTERSCEWEPTRGSHIPSGVRFGKGTGTKPVDLVALACPFCHDVADGRIRTDFDKSFVLLCWHDGLLATLIIALREGVILMPRGKDTTLHVLDSMRGDG